MAEKYKNMAVLSGTAATEPVFSHRSRNGSFFVFSLEAARLSGRCDILNIMIGEQLLAETSVRPGDQLNIRGSVRSFNNNSGIGSRLVISVYANALDSGGGEPHNSVILEGAICKPPIFRRTPLGREICDIMLAVGRGGGKADYLPCIAWGADAGLCAEMSVSHRLTLEGRLQSRKYLKVVDGAEQERVAFEISIAKLLQRA